MDVELVGRVLSERYQVVRPLGSGGMGAVYEAVQLGLNRRVALKVLAPEIADDPRYVERFRREAEAAAALGHPNIVQVTDFCERAGEPIALVMELLQGSSLQDILVKERQLAPARACSLLAQVLGALEAAHAAGIVHRDLKPQNVFVTKLAGGVELVKLLDFGVAKLKEGSGYARLTSTGAIVGTPRYAAPEQLDGRPIDARTDIYAAGVLLYCMVAGRPPFGGDSAQAAIKVLTTEPPDPRTFAPGLDPGLAEIIARAMRKQQSERYASAREMARALAPFIGAADPTPLEMPMPLRPALDRPSQDPSTPLPSHDRASDPTARARPSTPEAAFPATAVHTPSMPMAPRAPSAPMAAPKRSRGWMFAALGALVLVPIALCGGITCTSMLLRDGDTRPPTADSVPVSAPDAGEIAAPPQPTPIAQPDPNAQIALPAECTEYEELACSYPGSNLGRTFRCTTARTANRRFREQLAQHRTTIEELVTRCRAEADDERRDSEEARNRR